MKVQRSCYGCTKCCDGNLAANILGYEMKPGTPCHFKKQRGCSIYPHRPDSPCKSFACEWLKDHEVPIEMKPDVSDVVLVHRTTTNGIPFVEMVQAGTTPISERNKQWIMEQVKNGKYKNMFFKPDLLNSGEIVALGTKEFLKEVLPDVVFED